MSIIYSGQYYHRSPKDGHLLTRGSIIIGVQELSLMPTHPLGTKGWDGHLLTRGGIIK